ncbi:MAG: hypothetical protein AB1630_01495 [bacterium]
MKFQDELSCGMVDPLNLEAITIVNKRGCVGGRPCFAEKKNISLQEPAVLLKIFF